jgi:hypothetical protein
MRIEVTLAAKPCHWRENANSINHLMIETAREPAEEIMGVVRCPQRQRAADKPNAYTRE